MKRDDLITKMALDAEITKKAAGLALNSILDSITESLAKGEKVAFVGFGTFDVSERKARTGINPQTGKKIKIPARTVPVFRAGKKLKDFVK
ncbi:MAG: HU family DNA-binding protein [Candidatus Cloacimonas sp.]|jgi:DNA-binding protein HU-beta|nr:HU family DNA-binding protein [Candidatus Cloacimonadota bacterium]